MRTIGGAALISALGVVGLGCSKGSTPNESGPSAPSTSVPPMASSSAPASTEEASARAPAASTDEAPEPPLDKSPPGIAKVLAGIGELQRLVQQRLAQGREPNAACMAKLDARGDRVAAIENKMGGRRWLEEKKTRYACCAPHLGQTVDGPVVGCLMQCTEDDTPHNGSEDDDWGGPGGLREDCQHAATALADWGADLKAGKF